MKKYTRIIRDYSGASFRFTKGKIDIFLSKQFHNHYEIYLLLDGKVEFINDHIRKKIVPNSLVIIPPGEYHRFIVSEDSTDIYERCVLNINSGFLDNTILEDALKGKELLILSPNNRIVENFLYLKDAMLQNCEKDFEYILSGIATDIIFLIKQTPDSLLTQTHGFLHPASFQIMNYINQNYKSKITLQDIANHVYLSVSSVSHIFKEDFEVSIKQYITEKRMNEIHLCLQKGEKPQYISNEFGFSNYSTFYRSYCKYFGIPPSKT